MQIKRCGAESLYNETMPVKHKKKLRKSTFHIVFEKGFLSVDETSIDRETMGRLAKALLFICGPDNATAFALKTASESGSAKDIKAARTLFLRLKPGDRRAALTMISSE